VAFVGTFLSGRSKIGVGDRRLQMERGEGVASSSALEHRTFSGSQAVRRGRKCSTSPSVVSQADAAGTRLVEIAPGVDLQQDILDQMDFVPAMRQP
jgi:propionate CoA-transferase